MKPIKKYEKYHILECLLKNEPHEMIRYNDVNGFVVKVNRNHFIEIAIFSNLIYKN